MFSCCKKKKIYYCVDCPYETDKEELLISHWGRNHTQYYQTLEKSRITASLEITMFDKYKKIDND
jgi:hypothetical protein